MTALVIVCQYMLPGMSWLWGNRRVFYFSRKHCFKAPTFRLKETQPGLLSLSLDVSCLVNMATLTCWSREFLQGQKAIKCFNMSGYENADMLMRRWQEANEPDTMWHTWPTRTLKHTPGEHFAAHNSFSFPHQKEIIFLFRDYLEQKKKNNLRQKFFLLFSVKIGFHNCLTLVVKTWFGHSDNIVQAHFSFVFFWILWLSKDLISSDKRSVQ